MLRTRIIPVLLLKEGGLVKGKQFKNHKYVGDPINAVKIFNEKEVDELNNNLKNLRNNKIEDIWMTDLIALENAWNEHRDFIVKDYDNDRKGIVEPKAQKKKAKK